MKNPRYFVTTWDTETQSFSAQKGVKTGPYSQFGVRKAIRKLRAMGYPANYSSRLCVTGDPAVFIEKAYAPAGRKKLRIVPAGIFKRMGEL